MDNGSWIMVCIAVMMCNCFQTLGLLILVKFENSRFYGIDGLSVFKFKVQVMN
jgi:hypothetical protein